MALRAFSLCIVFGLIGSLINGCQPLPKEFREFTKLPRDQRIAKFNTLPIDKQIDFHLLNMSREPPDSSLAYEIAKQGPSVLPALLSRMDGHVSGRQSVDLLLVFRTMHKKFVDLSHNSEVIRILEKAYAEITHPTWKSLFKRGLDEIRFEKSGAGKISG